MRQFSYIARTFLTVANSEAKLIKTKLNDRPSHREGGQFDSGMVRQMFVQPLEAKLDMEIMGEATYIVIVILLSFVVMIVWAKWSKRKRNGK